MPHLVSYDLTNGNYDAIEAIIESLGDARRLQQSVWLLDCQFSSEEIRDAISPLLLKGDSLFVCRTNGWASSGVSKELTTWLKDI